jgi:hypothetical protein
MNCGLVPKFTSELTDRGVITTIAFNDNPNWTIKVDVEKQTMSDCYCPLCTRKMKLLRLKSKL